MTNHAPSFPDHQQNFWQLACMQTASQSVLNVIVGTALIKQSGLLTAIISICIGNLLLWLVGLGIISMAAQDRKNVMQIARDYLGRWGGLFVAIVLTLAFVFWYAIELKEVEEVIAPCLPSSWSVDSIGVLLGVCIAILGMGGIQIVKKMCVWSLPILFFILFGGAFFYGHIPPMGELSLSFSGIMTIAIVSLPGFVNLSTFFRHSRSRADSVLALGLICIMGMLVQFPFLFMNIGNLSDIFISNSRVFVLAALLFVFLSLLCLNLVNIYFASVGVEAIFVLTQSPWIYFWIGIVGSVVSICCDHGVFFSPDFLETFTNNYTLNFGAILLMSFLLKTVSGRLLSRANKLINLICLLIGCIVVTIVQLNGITNAARALPIGIWASALSFLVAVFFQRFFAVLRKLREKAALSE